MNYKQALQAIVPIKALMIMKLDPEENGGYVKFNAPCGHKALIKTFGDKKNLWCCPECKLGGNIISLYINQTACTYTEALRLLVERCGVSQEPITEEIKLTYDLKYPKELEKLGATEEFCAKHEIGIPQGKAMLSGCLTFLVRNSNGVKVAYYGLNLNTGKPVFHKSFNPELYLYNFHNVNYDAMVCDNFYTWLMYELSGHPSVCNFGLPYLSARQLELLGKLLSFSIVGDEMSLSAMKHFQKSEFIHNFHRRL